MSVERAARNLLQLRQQQQIIKDRARWLEQEVYTKPTNCSTRKETLLRLAKAGEYRDEETGNHVIRMAEYAFCHRSSGARSGRRYL